jgi:hypothetical protein
MRFRRVFALVAAALAIESASLVSAQGGMELASARLQIQGSQLTIFRDAATGVDDADQVLNVAEPARVRTCYGGSEDACGAVRPDDPRVAGLVVRGELSGPELPAPVTLETVPGGSFLLPGFQVAGTYVLQNIRLVEEAGDRVVGYAQPSFALLDVHRIVLASASIAQLSLEDLRERGIEVSDENFQAFSFLVGFGIGEETVTFEMPVLYEDYGNVQELDPPRMLLDGLSPDTVDIVERWAPPTIIPFSLEPVEDEYERPLDAESYVLNFPLLGAIVVPGTVTFLNQFFDAQLIVANGAPGGSGVRISDLQAAIQLPPGNPLRLHASVPAVASGLPVPVLDAVSQSPTIDAASQGSASWTLEGLSVGTHVVEMAVEGLILRDGREPLAAASRIQAAVDVVDPRFHLTFSHPDVIREGFEYSLFVTVANRSAATQNLITIALRDEHIVGAHRLDPDDDFTRTIDTIAPGESTTIEFPLVADLTGEVVASTFVSDSPSSSGVVELFTGVGDLGIPLSPATLRLSSHAGRLAAPWVASDRFWPSFMRFLGLAYSLAVAPPSLTPQGLPRVIPRDVESLAAEAGFAGQRLYLDDTNLRSLEVFLLDLLGNREPLANLDELRRLSDKGRDMGLGFGDLLRAEQQAAGLSASELWDHFVETVSYTDPHLAAMVRPAGMMEAPVLEIRRDLDGELASLAYPGDHPEALRSLPFGEIVEVSETAGGPAAIPMAVVGHLESETLDVMLHNLSGEPVSGRLSLLVPSGVGSYREVDSGIVEMPPGAVWVMTVGTEVPDEDLVLRDAFSGGEIDLLTPISVRTVTLPPFRLIGARRDLVELKDLTMAWGKERNRGNDRYGNSISYLFNRPPERESAETADHYAYGWTFDGFDTEEQPVHMSGRFTASAAFLQPSDRVVLVRYPSPLNPMLSLDQSGPLVTHTHDLQTSDLVDRWGESLDEQTPDPDPRTDLERKGSLIAGRVVGGDGQGVAGVTVQMIRIVVDPPWIYREVAGVVVTSSDGGFFFEFAEREHPDPAVTDLVTLRASIPDEDDPGGGFLDIQEVSTTLRRDGLLQRLNIALVGRGSVSGRLIWADDGTPVDDGIAVVDSALMGNQGVADVAPDGSFRFDRVAVGPVTVSGHGLRGERAYATVEIRGPGDHQDVTLRLPREVEATGTVVARVFQRDSAVPDGESLPVAGAEVAVYSNGNLVSAGTTNGLGYFHADDVPEGQVTVQASHWDISRSPAMAGAVLAAGATAEFDLTLVQGERRVVEGRVVYRDPETSTDVPVGGIPVFISGPGISTLSDVDGHYRLEGVPVQGIGDGVLLAEAIDSTRSLRGQVELPLILDSSPDVIQAADIVLRENRTAIRGLVFDPMGQPAAGVSLEFKTAGLWFTTRTTGGDGTFFVDDLPGTSQWEVVAHQGSGLVPSALGWFGQAMVDTYPGLTSFAPIQLAGSGTIRVQVRTESGQPVNASVYMKRRVYVAPAYGIYSEASHAHFETDPNGLFEMSVPVGPLDIVVYNPFFGRRNVSASIDWHGQVREIEAVFTDAGTVQGTVVDVDGVTPIPGAAVTLYTKTLGGVQQTADDLGRFRFDLVPEGLFRVEAHALRGAVERHGTATGSVRPSVTEFDVTVALEAQGTVRGRVLDSENGSEVPLPHARVRLAEGEFPNREFPSHGGWIVCDADGRFEIGGVSAGGFSVVAQHPADSGRQALGGGRIDTDWQVVEIPDLVLSTEHATIEILVRDPETGAPLADCPITLKGGPPGIQEIGAVSGADGTAEIIALPLGTYNVTAYHAPSGRTGRDDGLVLDEPLQHLLVTVEVDQRGEIRGVLWDDEAMTTPVDIGTVSVEGAINGGRLRAMDSTSMDAATLGAFEFLGVPEGTFSLVGRTSTSNRLGFATVTLSASSPVAEGVNLVLEPTGPVHVRLFERLSGTAVEVDPSSSVFALQLDLPSDLRSGYGEVAYELTVVEPIAAYPGHLYRFDGVLFDHRGFLTVQEMTGQRRTATVELTPEELRAHQNPDTPLDVVLTPMGVVRVTVVDGSAQPVSGAEVTLVPERDRAVSLRADDLGQVEFTAVPGGAFTVTAHAGVDGWGGRADGVIANDDDVVDVFIQLEEAHAVQGFVAEPSLGDGQTANPDTWVPLAQALVTVVASGAHQVMLTDDSGFFRFDALPGADFHIDVEHPTRDGLGGVSGVFTAAVTDVGTIVLDVDRPRVASIVPPNGMERVSRSARVDITFSEPLGSTWLLPDGVVNPAAVEITRSDGAVPPGHWSWAVNQSGSPVATFVPTQPYSSDSLYSATVSRFIADRVGRTMGVDVASTFRTADTEGPEVLGTDPDLARPFAEDGVIRVDFNEALFAASDDPLDVAAAGRVEWLNGDDQWGEIPISAYFTREHYSWAADPQWEGFELTGDTGVRRVTVRDLADHDDNPMTVWSAVFRMRDADPPAIDGLDTVPDPASGALDAGTPVTITPVVSGVDAYSWIGGAIDPPLPTGDIDRVDYFFTEPTAGAEANVRATTHPWSLEFVAAYVGDGVTPRPMSVWARAVDTSGNMSNLVRVDLEIRPNQAPVVGGVTVEATSPVPGAFYAGSTVAATVQGLSDADGAQLSVWAELRLADGSFVDRAEAIAVPRPIGGDWAELAPPVMTLQIPVDLPEGTALRVHAFARDAMGAEAQTASGEFAVEDDAVPPQITDPVARDVDSSEIRSRFTIGERFVVEARIADLETEVTAVRLTLDRMDLFPDAVTVHRTGTSDLFRSDVMTVPVDGVTEELAVRVDLEADDRGGNTAAATLAIEVGPEDDPEIPTVTWLTPWNGAPWPAGYQSVVAPAEGVALALTVHVEDLTLSGEDLVPGEIAAVEFRGPVVAAAGGVELAEEAVSAEPVDGSTGPGVGDYQVIWRIPNDLAVGQRLPFEVRVVDTGGHVVTRQVEMEAATTRRVYEAVNTAIVADDTMVAAGGDPSGTVFLLDGARLALYPQDDDAPRVFGDMALYAGGDPGSGDVHAAILSAPEVASSSSSRRFHPLNLRISGLLGIGFGAAVDVSGDGLLGCDPGGCVTLPGQTAPEEAAGGSHGGLGWYGSRHGGWDRSDLSRPGASYGAIRHPVLPGGGGGDHDTWSGGRGGGVLRLDATGATVHLAGMIQANGDRGDAGGGAGGSIWITANELRGDGRVEANGAPGANPMHHGGGAGGRIAVTLDGPASPDAVVTRCRAEGAVRGGAGTVYVENVAPGAEASGTGLVRLTQSEAGAVTPLPAVTEASVTQVRPDDRVVVAGEVLHGDPSGSLLVVRSATGVVAVLPIEHIENTAEVVVAAETAELQALADLLSGGEELTAHSREHVSALAAEGPVRLVTDAELAIGADAPALDDRSALDLTGGARVRLRNEEPTFTITATPLPNGDVRVGSMVTATWSVSDPLGVWMVHHQWPFDGGPRLVPYAAVPIDVVDATGAFPISATAMAGPVVLESTYTSLDGFEVTADLQWMVLENAQPTITLGLADGAPSTIQAGSSTQVVAHAEDLEGLQEIRVAIGGPSTAAAHVVSVTGQVVDQVFDVTASATADGTEPIVVTAEVEDSSGAVVASGNLQIEVTADATEPVIAIDLVPTAADDTYVSGRPVAITVDADDDVGVVDLAVVFDGVTRTSSGQRIRFDWIAPSVEGPTDFVIVAEAHDPSGNLGTAQRTVTVEPLDNPNAPVVRFACPVDRRSVIGGLETAVAVTLTDDDDIDTYRVFVDGVPVGDPVAVNQPTLSTDILWIPPYEAEAGTTFVMTVEATDFAGNLGSAAALLEIIEGDVLYEGGTLLGAQTTGRELILAGGEFTADGALMPNSLTLISGATLTTPVGVPLTVLADAVTVECSARIDATGKGYRTSQTYPGVDEDPTWGGGSHLGVGGDNLAERSTFGSVTRPMEMGGGAQIGGDQPSGGGAIRIVADSLTVNGAVLARGVVDNRPLGAGGSIWISVDDSITGDGVIDAGGGTGTDQLPGGGGAIAVEFGATAGSILGHVEAQGGYLFGVGRSSGAGTVYLYRHGVSTYGDLIVDNGSVDGNPTLLPALGAGAAAAGSGGAILETGLASIQPFFEGHWVEITDGSTGTLRGTWRIAGIAGGAVTLEANAEDGDPTVAEGDGWQGVYRFDAMTASGTIPLRSDDPIRVGVQTIAGHVEMGAVSADRLTVTSGGTITPPVGVPLRIEVSGEIVVETGGSIDATGKGYRTSQTYPGVDEDPTWGGGSHLGVGGDNLAERSTFGSVTRPMEMGGGAQIGGDQPSGGGAIRIVADSLTVNGAVLARGVVDNRPLGAGGSIWISVDDSITGDGVIDAGGGTGTDQLPGGGGAIAVEFGATAGSILEHVEAQGGYLFGVGRSSGAGTVYLYRHGVSTYGDLIVDNGSVDGNPTLLPALGAGAAAAGSGGAILETGLASIQPFFEGHWVEITDGSTGTLRGTWRIAGIAGGAVTLEANAEDGDPTVAEGDGWQGVYRFDSLTVRGNAHLEVPEWDRIVGDVTIEPGASAIFANRGGPTVSTALVSMAAHDGAFWISGAAGTVTDTDGVATASLRNLRTGDTVALAVDPDGSFTTVNIAGISGDELVIDTTDAHPWPESASTTAGMLPANDGQPGLHAGLIQVVAIDDATAQVVGAAGAVTDGEGPIALTLDNTASADSVSTVAQTDGSFSFELAAAAFDQLRLTATDGHPEPLSATLDLGEVPDATPPELVAGVLRIAIHDQHYWLWSAEPAFVDDTGIAQAAVFVDGDSAALQPLTLDADASVAQSMVVGPENGLLTVVVTDFGGNTIQADLAVVLPENDGPPAVNPTYVVLTTNVDRYTVEDRPHQAEVPNLVESADGASLVEWSVRAEPLATVVEAPCAASYGSVDLEPVDIVGAVGDSLWLRVVDDHPFGHEAETVIRQLPEITGAPVVDLGRVATQGVDGVYRVTGATDSVTDADGPISVTATAWRQTGEIWAVADEATVSVASGAPFVAELSAALEGDSIILTVADSAAGGPYVNRYRLGLLPAMTYAPTIDPAKFTLDLSGCTPRLVAEAGAVTSPEGTITLEVFVEHPDLGELEDNESFTISSGQAFSADIAEIEPGSDVGLWAFAQAGTNVVVATAPTAPVVHVDELELLRFDWGGFRLGIEGPDISDRVNPVEVRLTNLHPDRANTVTTTLPCDGGWGEAFVTAQPGDLLQMEACNGNNAQVCTGPIDLGGTPIGRKRVLDIGGLGVADLRRRGSGVLISTDDGNARWLRTPDLGIDQTVLTPLRGDVNEVFAPSWWGLGMVDGPAVYYWDSGNGVENWLHPLGDEVTIDAAFERQNHLFVVGRDATDLVVSTVAVDGRDARIQCAPPSLVAVESGMTTRALALLPLGAGRLGIVLDGTTSSGDGPPRIVPVDISDPWHPVMTEEDTSLVLNPAPVSAVVDARLDQGELVLETATGEFLIYTAVRPWEWEQRAAFGSRNGAWPTVATIWGPAAWVGYDNGDVVGYALAEGFNADPPEVAVLVHPSDVVSGIVTGNRALVVGLTSGLVAYELEESAIQPELHASAVRATQQTVSLAAGAAWSGPAGADLRASGTGVDGVGTPTAVWVDLGYLEPRAWWTSSFDLPSSVGGVSDVQWDTVIVVDRGSGFEDSLALADAMYGPPFLDVNCHAGVFSCGITTGAAGPGWRASGPDHQNPNWLRYRWTDGNGWNQHGFPSNSAIRSLESHDNILVAASTEILVAAMDQLWGPHLTGRTPFGGAPLGPVAFAADGSLVVVSAASGLELAVVDLADPRNPWIVTAAQVVGDGLGTVTDIHDDGEGAVWVLTADPDRIHRFDAAQLPNLVLLDSMDLDPSGRPVAMDTGRFDTERWGSDLAALFVVRRGVGLEMLDRLSLESGVLDQIPVTGDARDVFVGDLVDGLRILVAAGFDRGVVELTWSDGADAWAEHWLADLGHVRAFAYAADAYRDGEEWPETCQDFSHVDVKSSVPGVGTPRLYAITDAGILHVDTDLRASGFGAPALTVDPELISLDLSGCRPTLRGLPGSVVGNGSLSVSVHVDNEANPWGPEPWWSDPVSLASGAAFDIPLNSVDAGSVVNLTVTPELGAPQTLLVEDIGWDREFVIDESLVNFDATPDHVYIEVPFDAFPWRFEHLLVDAIGDTDDAYVEGSCSDVDDPYLLAIAAEPGEWIYLYACTGVNYDFCSEEISYQVPTKTLPGSSPASE